MTPTKWQRKSTASRDALLAAAMHAFHDLGYSATRVEDIVRGTGYTSGAFYHHFKDKKDCFWAVIEYRQRQRGELIEALRGLRPDTSLEDTIRSALAAIDATMPGTHAWILVMVDFALDNRSDADVSDRLHEIYRRWHAEIVAIVQALQAGGWVSQRRDVSLLASEIFAFVHGRVVHAEVFGIAPEQRQAPLIDGLVRLLGESAPGPSADGRVAAAPTEPRPERPVRARRARTV